MRKLNSNTKWSVALGSCFEENKRLGNAVSASKNMVHLNDVF